MDENWTPKFWARVDKNGPTVRPELDPCWIWTGSRLPKGYGRFYPATRIGLYAHRFSWELANGRAIPEGLEVMHACDNPPCVNPAHLSVGTRHDNAMDCAAKGRVNRVALTKDEHPARKLDSSQVATIRELAARGAKQRDLAKQYGVCKSQIGNIVRGECWRDDAQDGGGQPA